MTDDPRTHVTFDGGTPEEQQAVLAAYEAFWKANNHLDIPALIPLWRDNPEYGFFNSNGFNYQGLEDWLGIWRYYGPRFRCAKEATIGRVRIMIRGDMALVSDEGVDRLYEPVTDDILGPAIAGHPIMRATMAYTREADGWKCVHSHFSPASIEGERPWAPED
jgi:ketosteroid isomerase-like protein